MASDWGYSHTLTEFLSLSQNLLFYMVIITFVISLYYFICYIILLTETCICHTKQQEIIKEKL